MEPYRCNHDLHIHTRLSSCCEDENQTIANILQHAVTRGYDMLAFTDHVWDAKIAGASTWYAPQNIDHIKQSLPLPPSNDVRLLFGCETEYIGGGILGLHPSHFDLFDFIIVPPNHFHMAGFVRAQSVDSPDEIAELLVERLEEISHLTLPFEKVGIAHLTTGLLRKGKDKYEVIAAIHQERFFHVMQRFAQLGAGIELSGACFLNSWEEHEDTALLPYRIAKQAGCKFYLASDAHSIEKLGRVQEVLPAVIQKLALSESDRFIPAS